MHAQAANDSTLRGVWAAERYDLKDGTAHRVQGHIFFADREWTVLYFVLGPGEAPRRGSAEGGTYSLSGDRLVFTHHYHLSAGEALPSLPASPLRMEVWSATEEAREPCRVAVAGNRLTIFFPSGNSMTFGRLES